MTDEEKLRQRVRWCENKIEEKEYQYKRADGRARAYKGLYRKARRVEIVEKGE